MPSRFFPAEGLALAGIVFGAWLIHHAFQPGFDTPNGVLLLLGGLDILSCCGLLGYLLRVRLHHGERLPPSWVIAGVLLVAVYTGWISALLVDAERLRSEQTLQQTANQQELATLHRVRWHGVASAALTGGFLLLGSGVLWLIFDRELRRCRKASLRLAAAEAQYRALVEQQVDTIAVLDDSGNIVFANAAWQKVFGYSPEALRGSHFMELIHPADRPLVQLTLQQRDVQDTAPARLRTKQGIWHDVQVQCQYHDEDGSLAVSVRSVRQTHDESEQPSILKLLDC